MKVLTANLVNERLVVSSTVSTNELGYARLSPALAMESTPALNTTFDCCSC